jgi:hypothetical protein
MMMRLSHLSIIFLLVFLLSGCATWAQHGVTAGQNEKFRIALMPIEVTAEIGKISDIMISPPEVADEKKFIQEQVQIVSNQLTHALHSRLSESSYVEIVPIEPSEANTIIVTPAAPQAWNPEELAKLKTGSDIQAVLQVRLSGYGKMKRKWLAYLIGTGVLEGVVQGVLAAKLVDNTWVGIAIAVEEIGQEVLVWGGGSYLFNKYYAPVTLEAQLIGTLDGKSIWDDTVFVSVDKNAIEALPEEDRKKKEIQLNLTAKKALNELAGDLDETAKRNLSIRSDMPTEPGNSLKSGLQLKR